MPRLRIKSDVTGKVLKIVAQPGQPVAVEETILLLESMKMEIPVTAPARGIVKELLAEEGQEVTEGQELAIVET